MPAPAPTPRALSRAALSELLQRREGMLVSIHLPLDRSFPEAQQNPVRVRDAAREVAQRLAAAGLPAAEVEARRASIEALAQHDSVAKHPADGLAVFQDREQTRAFLLSQRVPQRVVLGDTFLLRPVLRGLHGDRRYHVLAVSLKRVALYEGDARGLSEAPRNGLPASLEDALGSEVTEKELRLRMGGRSGPAQGYATHGGDSAREEHKLDVDRFHHALAVALEGRLRGDDAPLVLAGDAPHLSGLRAMLRLPAVVADGVAGNPDRRGAAELHAHAWPLVERTLAARDAELAAAFERSRNHGKTVDVLDDVAAAALGGRVRRLWLAQDRRVPGRVDAAAGRVLEEPGAEADALEELAEIVLRHRGEVYVVEAGRMPVRGPAAAAELH